MIVPLNYFVLAVFLACFLIPAIRPKFSECVLTASTEPQISGSQKTCNTLNTVSDIILTSDTDIFSVPCYRFYHRRSRRIYYDPLDVIFADELIKHFVIFLIALSVVAAAGIIQFPKHCRCFIGFVNVPQACSKRTVP